MGLFPVHGKKTLITKENKGKWDRSTRWTTEKGLTIGHLECTITVQKASILWLISSGNTRYIYSKIAIAIAIIQETRWNKLAPQTFTSNGYNIYTSSLANNHKFGTAFLVDSKFNHMVINFSPINERLCVIRIQGRFFNYSLTNKWLRRGGQGSALWAVGTGIRSLLKSWHEVGDGRRERKSWPGNRTSDNNRQAQPAWEYKWKWPQTGRLCRRQANGDQKYVLHAQMNSPPNLALSRWTYLQPDWSLLDRLKTLFWRHRCYGAEGCKHRFRPHASRYKIMNKNMPCQQHKAATTETFRSRQTEG
jgi:hypothetical protein